jgi:hypothetical protein
MNKKIFSAALAAAMTNPLVSIPTTLAGSAIAIPVAQAGTFPGLGGIIKDTLPCVTLSNGYNNCILLHERINLFQGLRGSKPALQYCREKYGNDAFVVWRLGLRWCATPDVA